MYVCMYVHSTFSILALHHYLALSSFDYSVGIIALLCYSRRKEDTCVCDVTMVMVKPISML